MRRIVKPYELIKKEMVDEKRSTFENNRIPGLGSKMG